MGIEAKKNATFYGVALLLIIIGAGLFAAGAVSWILNCYLDTTVVSIPSLKLMGGLVVVALGYIVLELELIRKK